MEMEFFVPPDDAERWQPTGSRRGSPGTTGSACASSSLRVREHEPEERSHYSLATSDIEYLYPIGWSSSRASRTAATTTCASTRGIRHQARVVDPDG